MNTLLLTDLDSTLWEKQPWGGVISASNASHLRDLSARDDMLLAVNTGRPRSHVLSSFLRTGAQDQYAPWQDLPSNATALPMSLFDAGIFEDGLLATVNENGNFTEIFNSLELADDTYLRLCTELFNDRAQAHYRARGIDLILDGVVTEEATGYAVREDITARYLRPLASTTPMYRQTNETTKLTYKPALGPHLSDMRIDENHPLYLAVVDYLNTIEPKWSEHLGFDLPPDAIDMYPLHLKGHASGEIFRKSEANLMLLDRFGDNVSGIAYLGDGPNDIRAMRDLEERFDGPMLFVAPHKSNGKVIEFMNAKHRANVHAYHLPEQVGIAHVMEAATALLYRHGFLG